MTLIVYLLAVSPDGETCSPCRLTARLNSPIGKKAMQTTLKKNACQLLVLQRLDRMRQSAAVKWIIDWQRKRLPRTDKNLLRGVKFSHHCDKRQSMDLLKLGGKI
jgi:hypothetical protein